MKRVFNIVFFLLNVVLVAALLVSYLAIYINPDIFYIPAFFALAYPFILLGNVLVMCWWIFQMHLKFLMSLSAIITGWGFVGRHIQISAQKTKDPSAIKVMSYNVMNFGFEKNENSRQDILKLIEQEQPDILCMQEFYNNVNWPVDVEKKITEILHTRNYYFNNVGLGGKNYRVGTVVFSKFPILNSGVVAYPEVSGNSTIYVDLLINKIAVRVFNVHLQSIKFKSHEFSLVKDLSDNKEKALEESKSLINRMKKAYIIRAEQAKVVHDAIEKSPGKVLVCGDFNDVPASFSYQKLKDGLKDAFMESGSGFGISYTETFPGFRIDYILGSPSFELGNFEVVKKSYSDHYPITAKVVIK